MRKKIVAVVVGDSKRMYPYQSPDGMWDTTDEIPEEDRKAYYEAPIKPERSIISTPSEPVIWIAPD